MIRLSAFHFFSSCSSSICCCCYWHCCCCRPFVNSHFLPCFRIPCVSREKYAIFDLILRTFRFSCCWCHCYTNVLWTLCLLLLTHYTHTHEYMFWYNKSSEKQRTSHRCCCCCCCRRPRWFRMRKQFFGNWNPIKFMTNTNSTNDRISLSRPKSQNEN